MLPSTWRPRVPYAFRAVLVLTLCLALATIPASFSAFSATTGNPAGTWVTDTLDPPASFTASRPCQGPAYRASTTNATAGSTSLTVNMPATGARDYLVLSVMTYSAGTPASVNPAAGWTALGVNTGDGAGTDVRLETFARAAPASPPTSYTVTFSTSTAAVAGLTSYANTGSLEAWIGNYGTTSAATARGMTTNSANQLIVAAFAHTGTASSTPTGMTASVGVNGTGAGLHQYHQAITASGTVTGDKVSNISTIQPAWASFLVLLGPAYDPTVTLSWTATTDTYATGYEITRSPGSTTSVSG
jgi:hypothetical protein